MPWHVCAFEGPLAAERAVDGAVQRCLADGAGGLVLVAVPAPGGSGLPGPGAQRSVFRRQELHAALARAARRVRAAGLECRAAVSDEPLELAALAHTLAHGAVCMTTSRAPRLVDRLRRARARPHRVVVRRTAAAPLIG